MNIKIVVDKKWYDSNSEVFHKIIDNRNDIRYYLLEVDKNVNKLWSNNILKNIIEYPCDRVMIIGNCYDIKNNFEYIVNNINKYENLFYCVNIKEQIDYSLVNNNNILCFNPDIIDKKLMRYSYANLLALQKCIISVIIRNKKDNFFIFDGENSSERIFKNKIKENKNKVVIKNNKKNVIKKQKDSNLIRFVMRNPVNRNKGPWIQSANKMYYFPKYIKTFKFTFSKYTYKNILWSHYLFPNEVPKKLNAYSVGPNIFMKKPLEKRHKNKLFVADSRFLRDYLIDKFDIPIENIHIIPVYVSGKFYLTKKIETDKKIIGFSGYYRERDDIKNIKSLYYVAKKLPDVKFQMITSRKKQSFPTDIRNLNNLEFLTVNNNKVPDVMKYWSIYLSMSKRERGPATLQEARCLGVPTITPDHTGYSEFNNCISLPIKPYREHTKKDKDMIVEGIKHCFDNYDYYLKKCASDKHIFWTQEKTPSVVSKKWENFFKRCTGRE